MIRTRGLIKYYSRNKILDSLDLDVPKNSIYGFLGCNGAGKTTTLCILSGLVRKSAGKVIIDGKDLDKEEDSIKKIIGIMPQEFELYRNRTVLHNLRFFGKLKDAEKADTLLKTFDMEGIRHKKIKELSHGQHKLLLIIQAFLGDPKIVMLDEPISGFDPKKIVMLRKFIKKMSRDKTIIISSHNLDEVDRLCTHIGIIHNGKLILQGEKNKVKKGRPLEKVFIENI